MQSKATKRATQDGHGDVNKRDARAARAVACWNRSDANSANLISILHRKYRSLLCAILKLTQDPSHAVFFRYKSPNQMQLYQN